jgi:uncharacterized membrane protein YoaK (UPF0700 family)
VTDPATFAASRRAPASEGLRQALFDEREGPLPALLLALTVVAGVLDATTILALGHVFVAVITGNIVFLGLAAAGASGFSVVNSGVAIGGFLVGVLVGDRACRAARAHRGLALRNVLGVKVVVTAAVTPTVFIVDGQPSGGVLYAVLALLAMSMGAQLAAIRFLKVPDLVTVVLTLTVTGVLTERGRGWNDPTMLRRCLAVVAFALGVLLGAVLALYVAVGAALALGGGLIIAVAIAAHVVSRSEASWTPPRSV